VSGLSGRSAARAALVVLVAVVSLAGCAAATPSPSPTECACASLPLTGPPGGLSRDAAIAAAKRLAPPSSAEPTVVWAYVESDPFASPGTSDGRPVWEVRLQGLFAASPCPSGFEDYAPKPSDTACLDGDSGIIVVLDYYSGAWLGWSH
jgi:hypothetical protein